MTNSTGTSGWTAQKLVAFFEDHKISNNSYSIYADQDESYCVVREGEEWLIYYSEKGGRNHLGWGKNEPQALNILKLYVLEGCKKL